MIDIGCYLNLYAPLVNSKEVVDKLDRIGRKLEKQKAKKGRLLIFGNGASSSIASHAALDFTKQAKLESLCFHDPSLITAYSNDYGYDNAFKEMLVSYCKEGDIVFLVSVSGESENLLRVNEKALNMGLYTVSFTGRSPDNRLKVSTSESIWVDSHAYNIVENTHSIWITTLIDYLVGGAEYEVK